MSRDDSTPNGGGGSSHGRMTQPHKTEGVSSCHGMTRPPEKAGAPRERKPWDPHSVLIPAGGGRTRVGERGRETTPHPTNPGAGARWRGRSGATGRDGEGDNGGGGKDGDGSWGRGAPGSTPHQQGFGRGGNRPCRLGPRQPRRWNRRCRVLTSTDPRRSSGRVGGILSESEAGAGFD